MRTPFVEGRRPVRNDDRDGLHIGDAANARSKVTPEAASRSRLGAATRALP